MNWKSGAALHSILCAALLLSGCSGKKGTQDAPTPASDGKPLPIEGYGQVKLGTSLNDMISQFGRDFFNPKLIEDCVANLASKGCSIGQNPDHPPYTTIEGTPFKLASSFNTAGNLTDIQLFYKKEGDTSLDQCRAVYEKTLDWATTIYGKFYIMKGVEDTRLKDMATPKGNAYQGGQSTAQIFASIPLYTVPIVQVDRTTKPAINQRYGWPLFLFATVTGKPMCLVSLSFSEPDSIARRPGQPT